MKVETGNAIMGVGTVLIVAVLLLIIVNTFHIGATVIEMVYLAVGIFVWMFAGIITYEGLYAQKTWDKRYSEGVVYFLTFVGYGSLYILGGLYLAKYLWGF